MELSSGNDAPRPLVSSYFGDVNVAADGAWSLAGHSLLDADWVGASHLLVSARCYHPRCGVNCLSDSGAAWHAMPRC